MKTKLLILITLLTFSNYSYKKFEVVETNKTSRKLEVNVPKIIAQSTLIVASYLTTLKALGYY